MWSGGTAGDGWNREGLSSVKLTRLHKICLGVMLLAAIGILLGILSMFQIKQDEEQVNQTTEILLDQISQVIDSSKSKEHVLVESLKEDYVTRARAVSYTIDCKPEIEDDISELMKIASMMKVDEIHIFDESGVICGGTEPQYYGFSFDSGEQMSYFKSMLHDKHLTMCQDLTANTAESKMMMYAICWNETGTNMLQVGIAPRRLMEELRVSSIREIMQEMPTYLGVTLVVADENTGEIEGSTSGSLVGKTLNEIGIDLSTGKLERLMSGKVDGRESYFEAHSHEGYVIAVIQEKSVVHKNVPMIVGIVALYFFIAVGASLFVIMKLVARTDTALKNAKTDALTGFLNRRGYEDSVLKYSKTPFQDTFVYVSMDLNGLKQANDAFGHEMGDTLLKGAASCIRKCFADYGELFRVGGDEFVALIEANDQQLADIKKEFEETIKYWSLNIVKGLSVSCGFAPHKEFPDKTLTELARVADTRMYQAKQEYYKVSGVDRRRR